MESDCKKLTDKMSAEGAIKREDFVKDFLANTERTLLRGLPEKATNEEFVRISYGMIYIKLKHIDEGFQGISQSKSGD